MSATIPRPDPVPKCLHCRADAVGQYEASEGPRPLCEVHRIRSPDWRTYALMEPAPAEAPAEWRPECGALREGLDCTEVCELLTGHEGPHCSRTGAEWPSFSPEEPAPCLRHPDCLLVSEHKGRCEVPTADGATGPAESPASVALRELIDRIESGDARAVFVVAVCKDRNLEIALPGGVDTGVALLGLVEVLKARLAAEYIRKSPWSAPQDG